MHDGGPIKSTRARETEVSDENRSILSRSQPGRLWSFANPVRALHLHAGDGFGDAGDRGLIPRRGGARGRPFPASQLLGSDDYLPRICAGFARARHIP